MKMSLPLPPHQLLSCYLTSTAVGYEKPWRRTWAKADQILQKNGVTKVQAAVGMSVISLSRPTQPHIVTTTNGSVRCDCEGYKSQNICPHVIAVAHKDGVLQELVVKWEPNLSKLVQSSIPKAAPTPSTSKLLPHFDCSGLPKTMEETWAKADQILQKNGVTKVQATVGMSVVISLSRPTQPHIVTTTNGSVRCDCEGYKSRNICPHVIAVAHNDGVLQELVVKWEPNLSKLVPIFHPESRWQETRSKEESFIPCPWTAWYGPARRPPWRCYCFWKTRALLSSMAWRLKGDHLLRLWK